MSGFGSNSCGKKGAIRIDREKCRDPGIALAKLPDWVKLAGFCWSLSVGHLRKDFILDEVTLCIRES